MHKILRCLVVGGGLAAAMVGCGSLLDVRNPNDPETERVLASPADVEALIRGAYIQAKDPLIASDGVNMQLGAMSFEDSPMAANFGMIERSAIPRGAIRNVTSDQFHIDYYEMWSESYKAIRSASDGLSRLLSEGFTLGSPAANARAEAFAYFILGLGHGNLAVTYDQASVVDHTTDPAVLELVDYNAVMEAAMGYFDKAVATASGTPGITYPEDWLGVTMTGAEFAKLVNSFEARYRAQVARNPTERVAVNWAKVIAEVDAGITADYAVVDNDDTFDYWMQDYMSFKGPWHQVNYHVAGMADVSGEFQTWINTPLTASSRNPIVIQTPDRRWPQGATLAAQFAAPGKYIRAKSAGGEGGFVRADRGTWRWSNYLDDRYKAYYAGSNVGLAIPIVTRTEMDLLKAEGLINTNRAAEALPLINNTRVANGQLPDATAAGAPGGPSQCVPKLPNGTCGNLLETLKWEKRMEQFMTVYGGWFFDSRGWGDLAEGTPLHYPVPARELEVRQMELYTFGGVGQPGSAPRGTYGY